MFLAVHSHTRGQTVSMLLQGELLVRECSGVSIKYCAITYKTNYNLLKYKNVTDVLVILKKTD